MSFLFQLHYRAGINSTETELEESCQLARKIYNDTNYKILPMRIICPEKFDCLIDSLEAKKKILLDLSPMLSEAEEQKQKVMESVESITRCKVGKVRGRGASYDYTDVDTKSLVDYEEYERRYRKYVYYY